MCRCWWHCHLLCIIKMWSWRKWQLAYLIDSVCKIISVCNYFQYHIANFKMSFIYQLLLYIWLCLFQCCYLAVKTVLKILRSLAFTTQPCCRRMIVFKMTWYVVVCFTHFICFFFMTSCRCYTCSWVVAGNVLIIEALSRVRTSLLLCWYTGIIVGLKCFS